MEETPRIQEDRQWQADGWTALVIKNEDDDGWAVSMTKDGASEPALVGPWTMGRNKKDPKPLDKTAFSVLVKTATEFVGRQAQQQFAALNKSLVVTANSQRVKVTLAITPDDDNPSAELVAHDEIGNELARKRVEPGFALTRASAEKWLEGALD